MFGDPDEPDGTWRPWRELRNRADVELVLCDLPAGVPAIWCRDPETGARAILLDKGLSPAERLGHLAHELVHDERGGAGHQAGLPPRLAAVVAREEHRTDETVASRLVPRRSLAAWVAAEVDLGHQVTAERAAERFDVSVDVAGRALRQLERGVA